MRDAVEVPFHPIAAIFPLMEGLGFRELVEDIRIHGLREPIVLFDGAILDGRNRYRACGAAQAPMRFVTYSGKDACSYVVSVNLHRRHLDASQRAMVAAQIENLRVGAGAPKKPGRRDRGGRLINQPLKHPARAAARAGSAKFEPGDDRITTDEAGRLFNISGTSVLHAKQVLSGGTPELIEAVKAGEASVAAAAEFARLPKEQQTKILKSKGPSTVAVIGRASRAERMEERRIRRGSAADSTVAVFDHIKIGDGRSIGSVRMGEIRRLAGSLQMIVDVLLAVADHVANADHGDRVRDVIKESTLGDMIAEATKKHTLTRLG